MKRLAILALAIMALTQSCRPLECEAFDTSHPILQWHLFPAAEGSYTFRHDSLTTIFRLTDSRVSEYEKYWCHMCYCSPEFFAEYSFGQNSIRSYASYVPDEDFYDPGQVAYGVNRTLVNLHATADNMLEPSANDTAFQFNLLDSISLNGTTFFNVAEVAFANTNAIDRIWVARQTGLVAYRSGNETWTRD